MRTYRRAGYAGAVAVAAAALTIAGCSSSSSSSAPSASTSATSAASSPAAASTGSAAAGTSVTNYLSYVGGKSGPANSSLPPVTIGYVNEQGDANPPGPLATVGAQMAVTYINDELGGVDGHPLKLDTCFTTTEQQGTTCADQLLGQQVAQAPGRLDGPGPVLEPGCPAKQLAYLALGGPHLQLAQEHLLVVDGHGGVRALVRVYAYDHAQMSSSVRLSKAKVGTPDFSPVASEPLLSHTLVRPGEPADRYKANRQGRQQALEERAHRYLHDATG